jgi:quinol monooxygenase YgiN
MPGQPAKSDTHQKSFVGTVTNPIFTAESGCISYTFSADLVEPGLIHVFEEWQSQDALDAHFKAPLGG